MKKIFIILCLLFCASYSSSAQIKACGYFDGYWSKWANLNAEVHGNYDGFIIYLENEGPWEYRFKFTINFMSFPERKQRKKDIKENKWYEFSGIVEYYVTDNYPSIISIFRANKGPMFAPLKLKNGQTAKKVKSRATIKIAAFKDRPKTYNIFFDNVALGIDMGNGYFPGQDFK